jgi:MFS family permease
MYSVAVVLPRLQAEFGAARGDASLPYTLTMIGFGFGGILMGRLADRFGVMVALMIARSAWAPASSPRAARESVAVHAGARRAHRLPRNSATFVPLWRTLRCGSRAAAASPSRSA